MTDFNSRHGLENYFNESEKQIANIEIAWAKAALFFRTNRRFGHPTGSMRAMGLIEIRERLEVLKKRTAQGNTLAILSAVAFCAEENLPLPEWLATDYQTRLDSFLLPGGPASLDDIFHSSNLPTDTPKKKAIANQNWQLGGELWDAVWKVSAEHPSLASALKAVLSAGNFGVKNTTARKLVLMIDHNHSQLLGEKRASIEHFFDMKKMLERQKKP